jgi:hypothetical protein
VHRFSTLLVHTVALKRLMIACANFREYDYMQPPKQKMILPAHK